MGNMIIRNKVRKRPKSRGNLKRDEMGNYMIYSKEIDRGRYRNKISQRNRNKRHVPNKIVLLLISIITLMLIVGHLDKSKHVKFLDGNPYSSGNKIEIKDLQKELPTLEKKLGIHDIEYKWNKELEYNNKPNLLVFHHAASSNLTPQRINDMHIKKDWAGIGYHFYIRKDGTIYRGRPEDAIGAHIKGQNRNTLGICIEGNLQEEEPTEEEIQALEDLSTYLIVKYNISKVQGHGDTYDTLCPGVNFPMESVKENITKEIENIK